MEREGKLIEDQENQADEVSYGDKWMVSKSVFFTLGAIYLSYRGHLYMQTYIKQRDEALQGTGQAYEATGKMTDKQRANASPGGDWELKQINGQKFGSQNLRGSYYMLFFGHTLCPEATPLSVHKMSKTLDIMKKNQENQYITCKSVFVSVKPEQDTKDRLKQFKSLFSSSLIVLTGKSVSNTDEALIDMMRKFKVPVGLSESEIA